jgi:N4-gp56 family major capsid protein
MASTLFNSSLEVSRWRNELYTQAKKDTYFSRFFGGANSIIHVKDDLKAAKGKDITFGLKMKIEGDGVTGDNTLAGNEVAIDTYSQTITLDQLRQGIISTGKMHNKKVLIDFRSEALDSLKVWFAETMEQDMVDVLSASCTRLFHGISGAFHVDTAASGSVATTDVITPAAISRLVAMAKLGNSTHGKIRPVRVGGKDYYVLILHPEAAHELKNDSTFMNAQQYAMPRGADNPLFSGALGAWDGCVIHEHDMVKTFDNGAGSAHYATNLFLGAQAGCAAFGGDHSWHEELVDRGNKLSVSASIIYEFAKTTFNSADFACIGYSTATTKLT